MGSKGVLLVVAALSLIACRRVLATCGPCPLHVRCGTPPSCSYGVTTGLCSCGCKNACIRGPGEDCGGYLTTGYTDYCVAGFRCQIPTTADDFQRRGVCVPQEPQDPCSPGLEFFKHKYVYDGSNSVLTTEIAKEITRRKGDKWQPFHTSNRKGSLALVYTVYDGRNITYHLHPSGETCYTNFVKSYRCLDPPNFNQDDTCERDGDGPYCAALFRIDSGLYEGDICRKTPELGNSLHPLASYSNPCSPGHIFFKHKHVYDRSNNVFNSEIAKKITDSHSEYERMVTINTVYDGRNMIYQLHPDGEFCYTNLVESYRCLDTPTYGNYRRNSTCERDEDGPYCAALFRKDSGLYERDICRDTPKLGNNVHPLVKNCSSPWFIVDNQCFLRVAQKWNWASSLSYCRALASGAGLAQPNNIKALTANLNITDNGYNSVLWLGGSDSRSEGSWHWINDASNITTGWQDNQPDNDITVNKDGQDCLTMWTGRGPGHNILADTNCEDNWNFLCERY